MKRKKQRVRDRSSRDQQCRRAQAIFQARSWLEFIHRPEESDMREPQRKHLHHESGRKTQVCEVGISCAHGTEVAQPTVMKQSLRAACAKRQTQQQVATALQCTIALADLQLSCSF